MQDFFGSNGPFMEFLRKAGLLILISLLWLVGSVPIITIGTSSAAMYYTVVKVVRHERSHIMPEFIRAYKRNLIPGILLTIVSAIISFMVYLNREVILAAFEGKEAVLKGYFLGEVGGSSISVFVILCGISILLFAWLLYIIPVMTRFEMSFSGILKLSFYLMIRYFYYTIIMMVATAFLVFLFVKVLPLPALLILPGGLGYGWSFFVEKAMRPHMGEAKEGEDAWWLE